MNVALWFACEDDTTLHDIGLLLAIRISDCSPAQTNGPRVKRLGKYNPEYSTRAIIESESCDLVAWEPPPVLERLLAQKSFFVFSEAVTDPQSSLPLGPLAFCPTPDSDLTPPNDSSE